MEGVDINSFDDGGSTGGADDGLLDLLGADDTSGTPEDQGNQPAEEEVKPESEVDPENPDGEQDDDPVMEIVVDGQKQQMKLSELTANAQKYLTADRRLEEASEANRQLEPARAALAQERANVSQYLNNFLSEAQAWMRVMEPPWQELLAYDKQNGTNEYLQQRHVWEERQQLIRQAAFAQQQLQQREEAELATQLRTRALATIQSAIAEVPEWKDRSRAANDITAIESHLRSRGCSDADIMTMLARFPGLLIDAKNAIEYQKLLAKKAEATQRVQSVPKATLRPGARQSPTGGGNQRGAAAASRFAKNPSIETLADLL